MKRQCTSLIGLKKEFNVDLSSQVELQPSLALCLTSASHSFPIRDTFLDILHGELEWSESSKLICALRATCRRFAADALLLQQAKASFDEDMPLSLFNSNRDFFYYIGALHASFWKRVDGEQDHDAESDSECDDKPSLATDDDLQRIAMAVNAEVVIQGASNADFSALSQLPRSVTFCGCPNLQRVSVFSALQMLRLICCDTLVDVSPFRHVPDLAIVSCAQVADVACLASVKTLYLEDLPLIRDISALCNVPWLAFFGVKDDIFQLANPMRNRHLTLGNCFIVRVDAQLSVQESLTFQNCDVHAHFDALSGIPQVEFQHCRFSGVLGVLHNVQSLTLEQVIWPENFVSFVDCATVDCLTLSHCDGVTSLDGLQHVRKSLVIEQCLNMDWSNVMSLRSVPSLYIDRSDALSNSVASLPNATIIL